MFEVNPLYKCQTPYSLKMLEMQCACTAPLTSCQAGMHGPEVTADSTHVFLSSLLALFSTAKAWDYFAVNRGGKK